MERTHARTLTHTHARPHTRDSQVTFTTDFRSGGSAETTVTFDGLQLNGKFSPSVFFMGAVALNILWIAVQLCSRRNQSRVARRMELREGYATEKLGKAAGGAGATCCGFECGPFLSLQLMLLTLLVGMLVADFCSYAVGRESVFIDSLGFEAQDNDDAYQ